ncbi:MAG: FMN-binding protein [Phycisphaerales bacterium]|nr:MAG: FMN-binding protein [Phycisphaerales bacterium]
MSKIKCFLKQSWVMMIATFIFGITLALAQTTLGPKIEKQEQLRMNQFMQELVFDANSFDLIAENLILLSPKGKILNITVYQASSEDGRTAGYAFTALGPGWGGTIKLVIAVDSSFERILGYQVLTCNETPNLGDKIRGDQFRMQFVGVGIKALEIIKVGDRSVIDNSIVAITGATYSSEYVVDIFNNHLVPIKQELQSRGIL